MSFKIVSIPGKDGSNPYIRLFYEALLPHGIELVDEFDFNIETINANINRFDAVHLHWPEGIWRNYVDKYYDNFRSCNIKGSWFFFNKLRDIFRPYLTRKKHCFF